MINKFSLTFKDEQQENHYQEYVTDAIRKPLLLKIIINQFAFIIISLIQYFIQETNFFEDSLQQVIFAIKIILLMSFLLVYQKKPQIIKWVILFFNHVLLFYFYNNTQVLNFQEQMFAAQAIVCLQIINIQSGDFTLALYQIIFYCSFYLIFSILKNNYFHFISMVQVLCAIFILSSMCYSNMKALRCQFQLNKIDNQWEQIFKVLAKDQYLIFQYNEIQQNFTLNGFYENIKNNNDLRNFLRQQQIKIGQSLEQFLYDVIKQNKKLKNIINQMQFSMKIHGKQQKFIYSIFYGASTVILLQIKNDSLMQKSKQCSIEKMYQTRFKQFLLKMTLIIKRNQIQQNNSQFVQQISKHSFYAYLKEVLYNHNQASLLKFSQPFSCRSIIRILQYLYQHKTISYEQKTHQEMIGCKQIIFFTLMEIIERILSKQINFIFEQIDNQRLQIKINCIYNPNKINLSNLINKYQMIILFFGLESQCNVFINIQIF